ncbi:MAG: LysR family transcriptional regulator [Proteobacteria bacterium]|nr:LysR family transcriptional regulator [Pseudomonadota bacterium]
MAALAYLASFHTVSQTLNISVAAKQLGLTQPSLSRQIKCLEDELGFKLFMRRQHGISLTEEALKLAQSIDPVLTTLKERLSILGELGKTSRQTVKVGSLTEIGRAMLVPKMLNFYRDHTDVTVELTLAKNHEVKAALKANDMDFGIVSDISDVESLSPIKWASERSVLVTRSSNIKKISKTGDLLASTFVAYTKSDPLLQAFIATHFPAVQSNRIQPKLMINDHRCIVECLLTNDLFAVMPIHSIAGHLESGTLKKACDLELTSDIWLVQQKKRSETAAVRAFLRCLMMDICK